MIWLNVLHMNPVWSLVVLAAASLEYLMPELSRPGVAFSVTVDPEFRRSTRHARIVRYYRRGVLISALAGLLIAVAPRRLDALLDALAARGVAVRAVIGRVEPADAPGRITVA